MKRLVLKIKIESTIDLLIYFYNIRKYLYILVYFFKFPFFYLRTYLYRIIIEQSWLIQPTLFVQQNLCVGLFDNSRMTWVDYTETYDVRWVLVGLRTRGEGGLSDRRGSRAAEYRCDAIRQIAHRSPRSRDLILNYYCHTWTLSWHKFDAAVLH